MSSNSAIYVAFNSAMKMSQGGRTCHSPLEDTCFSLSHATSTLSSPRDPFLSPAPLIPLASNALGFNTKCHSSPSCPQPRDLISHSAVYIASIFCSSQEEGKIESPDSGSWGAAWVLFPRTHYDLLRKCRPSITEPPALVRGL